MMQIEDIEHILALFMKNDSIYFLHTRKMGSKINKKSLPFLGPLISPWTKMAINGVTN